ncbi:MAG TPA: hypothetical protein VN033_02535 [Vulgatibacter sp.]|nr:hypothetical protein [Vulgatibacter sp.]
MAQGFGLPPPVSAPKGRRLVQGVFAIPRADVFELRVLIPEGLSEADRRRVEQRVQVAENVLKRKESTVSVIVLRPEACTEGDLLSTGLFGGLLAGRPPGLVTPASGGHDADAMIQVAEDSPSPLAALALMRLVNGSAESLPDLHLTLRGEGLSTLRLADPDLLAALWADRLAGGSILRAAAVAADDEKTRDLVAGLLARRTSAAPAPTRRAVTLSRERLLLDLGRELAVEAARSVRSLPRKEAGSLRRRLRREVLGPPVPLAILPREAAGTASGTTTGRLESPLGRPARGEEHAFLRRLDLAARLATRQEVDELGPFWLTVLARLAENRSKPVLLLEVDMADVEGPPHDPLNRGPSRVNALRDPLLVLLRPSGKPSARRLSPREAVFALVRHARAGDDVEVIGGSGTGQAAAARLERLAQLCASAQDQSLPVTLEVGGEVLLLEPAGRIRTFNLHGFAHRPRLCIPDPAAPDLAGSVGRQATTRRHGATVECEVMRLDDEHAALLYYDGKGRYLREVIPLGHLEDRVQEVQAILRLSSPPTFLTVRVADDLDSRRVAPPADRPLAVRVEGDAAWGLRFHLQDRAYGHEATLGWRDAAAWIVENTAAPLQVRLSFTFTGLRMAGKEANGFDLLYARSVVARRLRIHIRSVLAARATAAPLTAANEGEPELLRRPG